MVNPSQDYAGIFAFVWMAALVLGLYWLFGCLLMVIPFLQTFLLFIPSTSRIPTGGQNPINSGHISPVPRTHSTITSLAHSTTHSPSNSAAPLP